MGMRWICAGIALAALGACDDIATENEMTYAELVEANADMAARVAALPATAAADMPTTGSAVFEGYAALTMDTEAETDLVGTATITADFEAATLSGALEGFRGRVDGSSVQELGGELAIADGDIGLGSASGFGAEVEGELTGTGGSVLGVDGTVVGTFRGDNGAEALTGVQGPGTDFTLDGVESGGLLTIVAEER